MSYLLDTNVVSELMKTPGAPAAIAWVDLHDQMGMHLSVVTLMELRKGIQILPVGRRRQTLDRWLSEEVPIRFGKRILFIDDRTADICGRFSVIVTWYPTFDG